MIAGTWEPVLLALWHADCSVLGSSDGRAAVCAGGAGATGGVGAVRPHVAPSDFVLGPPSTRTLTLTTEFDPTLQIGLTEDTAGTLLTDGGHAEAAIPRLERNVERWIEFGSYKRDKAPVLRNLNATLTNLAKACQHAGRLEQARIAAEEAVVFERGQGSERDFAESLRCLASILGEEGSYGAAAARLEEASEAAVRAGDEGLLADILQYRGRLEVDLGHYDCAEDLCQRALKLFQAMEYDVGVMRTCNLLGVTEQKQGRLPEARAWYERSREIALRLGDTVARGIAELNLGIAWQLEGKAAVDRDDQTAAEGHFAEAERWIRESLRIFIQLGNKPWEASAWSQLAQLFLLRGQVDEAEKHAHRAREIRESLDLKEVYREYRTLAEVARARGDERAAAEWQRKCDNLLADLQRRAGAPSLQPQGV